MIRYRVVDRGGSVLNNYKKHLCKVLLDTEEFVTIHNYEGFILI